MICMSNSNRSVETGETDRKGRDEGMTQVRGFVTTIYIDIDKRYTQGIAYLIM